MRRRRWMPTELPMLSVRLIVATVGVVLLLGSAPTATAEPHPEPVGIGWSIPSDPAPPQYQRGPAATLAKHHLQARPHGSNNWTCSSAKHPEPVILVHGSDSSAYSDWAALSPQLVADGFCVFALNYGGAADPTTYGTEDLAESGEQVGEFVDMVRSATHARKVDLVGYSQGATATRYYVDRLGGAPKVARWVGLASPTYGGIMYGAGPAAQSIPGLIDVLHRAGLVTTAVRQQMQGSDFLTALNAGGDTVPGPAYTTIGSDVDEMIQPYTNIALRDPGTTNITVQKQCPVNLGGHFNMVYDPFALRLVENALDPQSAVAPQCVPVALGAGIPEVILSAHSGGSS